MRSCINKTRQAQVIKIIDSLLTISETTSYRELMKQHGFDLRYGQLWCGEDVSSKAIEIKRRAFIKSVREFKKGRNPHNHSNREYHFLQNISRELYPEENGKTSWQQALEAAGESPPRRFRKDLSLRTVLVKLKTIGNNPEDFPYGRVAKIDSGLVRFAERYLGSFGKLVMLAGIDYKNAPFLKNVEQILTSEDIKQVINDKSLTDVERARAVFYGLSLQYYPFEYYRSQVTRNFDSPEEARFINSSGRYLRFIRVQSNQYPLLNNFNCVTIELDRGIPARFHRTDFNFIGDFPGHSEQDAISFRKGIESMLGLQC